MPAPARPVVAVVLAAGAGSRFGGPVHKLDVDLGGSPLLAVAVQSALASQVGPVVVVTGPPLASAVPAGASVVLNADWRAGQLTSLRCGIEAATRRGAERVVVGLGDQPGVTPEAWRAVAAAGATAPIAVATYTSNDDPGGLARRGHPVSLAAAVWDLLPAGGDEGARALMRLRPDLVREVPCDGSTLDIDTLEDLHRWQNNSSTSSP